MENSEGSASAEPQFTCRECDKCFVTKIGLGVHRQSKHTASYNAEISTERVKARWTPEESHLLAKLEVELLREGVSNINQALHSALQRCDRDNSAGRTYDSIKSHRRHSAYRTKASHLLAVAEDQPPGGAASVGPQISMKGSGLAPELPLVGEIRSLTGRQAPKTHGAVDLWILARLALDGVDVASELNNYI
ncbi:unnamed protein product [Ixodes persulcatus]